MEFAQKNYWNHHGLWFLVFVSLFPRLTLLLSSVSSGGLLWWLGWAFAPRFLVAILATLSYWNQNPFLVSMAWLIAIGGESTEKVIIYRRRQGHPFRRTHIEIEDEVEMKDVTPK